MVSRNLFRGMFVLNEVIQCRGPNCMSSSALTQLYRFKSNQSKSNKSSGSSDSEKSDLVIDDKVSRTMKINVTSRRVDLILKSGLGIARNKIEKLFYESKIRLNGEKIGKKSEQVEEGDEIDVLKGPSPNNPELLVVARVEVLSMKPDDDSIAIKIRRSKSLLVENYDKVWKPL
ncbi:hypothetical protein HHI36_007654 [Cryptolaemus montrouzieri]|uniref:RNA-binding S4 domain-containing protein n=1 Tax=Cryptolaemus montrouzieri TaxID=559131 RepID=A0ABD2MQ79_9CUCU